MENTQKSAKRKLRDEIPLEEIFRLIKETWPQLKNVKIHKALKTILELGLNQSPSKERNLSGLRSVAKLLIDNENVSEVNELLELAIENDDIEASKVLQNHGSININSFLHNAN